MLGDCASTQVSVDSLKSQLPSNIVQVVKKEVERVKSLQAWEICKPLSITFKGTCAELRAGTCPSLVTLRQTVSQSCSGAGATFLQGSTGQRGKRILKAANDLALVSSGVAHNINSHTCLPNHERSRRSILPHESSAAEVGSEWLLIPHATSAQAAVSMVDTNHP